MPNTTSKNTTLADLANLRDRLIEEQDRLARLLQEVEEVMKANSGGNGAKMADKTVSLPRCSSLDEIKEILNATKDLRTTNGNLSAERIAKLYGVSLSELAGWLGKSRQTVSKTPDAEMLQTPLSYFERVARLRAVVKSAEAFRKWLRTPNDNLDNESPLDLMRKGEWQVMADYVDDMITGTSN